MVDEIGIQNIVLGVHVTSSKAPFSKRRRKGWCEFSSRIPYLHPVLRIRFSYFYNFHSSSGVSLKQQLPCAVYDLQKLPSKPCIDMSITTTAAALATTSTILTPAYTNTFLKLI
jgi:hypothetical protein